MGTTKKEQVKEILEVIKHCGDYTGRDCAECDYRLYGHCNNQKQCEAEALYNAGYRKIDEFEKCRKCPAWSGTDCTRNPYTEGCLDDKVNLKNEIKRLEKENEQLKAKLEARLTCDFVKARQNYAMQDFAGKLKDKLFSVFGKTICSDLDTEDITDIIDELLKEYEE